ncbi:hypothetical protein [uncultured Marixanthomonas sp.]|uniref:hypothetical protein n=1 Tax=uncultured Marixanthomonas sp. TaxID=757245 RepID=UPI0030D781CA|tara:strand:- start:19479 stop:19994 length:516 start_codon:yes stop_codon:yes gene_type:complete
MNKARLIKRLKWYYPIEKFHAYVTFPALLLFLLFTNPVGDLILISYGLIVCIIILYQGQLYWKLKLERLTEKHINQAGNIRFFKKSKRFNWLLISGMIPVLLIQLYIQKWNFESNNMFYWGIFANVFAILEHINYYYLQLMIDNKYDVEYLFKNKKLKKASLAKDLIENKI